MSLKVCVLGSLRVGQDCEPQPVALSARERAVLTLLALNRGRIVTTSRLIDELWPDDPPSAATNTVQVYLSRIRRAVGAANVVKEPAGYALAIRDDDVDVAQFETLAVRAEHASRAGRFAEASDLARRALALWPDDGFADTAGMPALEAEFVRLGELKMTLTEGWVEADLALGRGPDLVATLQRLTEQHPLHERLRASLMTALVHAGRQSEALDQFTEFRRQCVDELGIEPGPAIRNLQRAILDGGDELMPLTSPTRRMFKALGSTASVPTPTTALLGRDEVLSDLLGLVTSRTARLVTLIGMGGAGKTRLAIEVANAAAESFPDGVYFVPLADVVDVEAAVATISDVVDLPAEERSVNGLVSRLAVLDAFLVLDNLEQVEHGDGLIARLVTAAPDCVVLVTSRRPLQVAAEHRVRLAALDVPVGPLVDDVRSSPAAQLFVERAQMAGANLTMDAATADAVARICWRLEGSPLAIEIAAARTTLLPPRALAGELGTGLTLTDSSADRPERQRSLEQTIAWSYGLVETSAQAVLRALSVHAGATIDAVSVTADADVHSTAGALTALVDSALVTADLQAAGGPRFTMPTAVRAFAQAELDRSGEGEAARDAHAGCYLAVAEQLSPHVRHGGAEFSSSLHRLAVEHDNVRAALAWTLEQSEPASWRNGETGAALAVAFAEVWRRVGGIDEAVGWLGRAADAVEGSRPDLLAACLGTAADVQAYAGRWAEASALASRQVDVLRAQQQPIALARALASLAATERAAGASDNAHQSLAEAVEIARTSADGELLNDLLTSLVDLDAAIGRWDECADLCAELTSLVDGPRGGLRRIDVAVAWAAALGELGRHDEAVRVLLDRVDDVRALVDEALGLPFADQLVTALEKSDHPESAAALLGSTGSVRERTRLQATGSAMGNPYNASSEQQLFEDFERGRQSALSEVLDLLAARWTGDID